jgi:palmitoyltransferase ZDHHC4
MTMMNWVALLAITGTYVMLLLVVVYFCVCADPSQSPTAHYLTITLPKLFWTTLAQVLGPKAFDTVSYVLDRALLLFYVIIVYGSWSVIFAYVYPWIGRQDYLPHYHRIVGIVVFVACVISWRIVHTSSPGIITAETVDWYDHFPYDGLLYESGRTCPTRHVPKLARSKFDRHLYGENIPRFDHFCGWVHNSIGEENYRWFLLFLVIHVGVRKCHRFFRERE